jgi:SAM-dependent methyltransferase
MDVTALAFQAGSFDAAVATFLFCVLPESLQVPALRELGRVVRPGGLIRLLEYVRPRGTRPAVGRALSSVLRLAVAPDRDRRDDQREDRDRRQVGRDFVCDVAFQEDAAETTCRMC